jgi:dihydrofolate reductase
MTTPLITLILARADNGVIGAAGGLPWHIPEDLRRFKELTLGKPCIMGRKTWNSLPRKPLPGRSNIVITRNASFAADGAIAVGSFDEAVARAMVENPAEIMVIGGSAIFAAGLARADRIHLTEVHAAPEGDVRFPAFSSQVWRETTREARGPGHSYVTLERMTGGT